MRLLTRLRYEMQLQFNCITIIFWHCHASYQCDEQLLFGISLNMSTVFFPLPHAQLAVEHIPCAHTLCNLYFRKEYTKFII